MFCNLLFLSLIFCLITNVLAISKVSSVIYGGSYKFSSSLELSDSDSNPVGYQITAAAKVQQINPQLLLVKLEGTKLHFATKKLPNVNFKESKSTLDSVESTPFFVEISDGTVKNLYSSADDDSSILSIKKGLASLLQIKSFDGQEIDSSGTCDVKYEVIDNLLIKKVKSNCHSAKEKNLWGGNVVSTRSSEINLDNGKKLLSVVSKEEHVLKPSLSDFDIHILTKMELIYEADYASKNSLGSDEIDKIISNAEKEFGHKYTSHTLTPGISIIKQKKITNKFSAVVKDNLKGLSDKEFGSKTSAIAALNVLSAAKEASYDDIYKTLKSKSNKKIRGQLVDILGGVQTEESHKAAMKFLNLTSQNYNLDLCERYLWALSISPAYEKSIIQDLLELSQTEISDLKLYETLIQTVSSMIRKYSENTKDNELLKKALEVFTNKLKNCKKDDDVCHRIYLKSFKNIASPSALNIILEYALNGAPSVGMRAMRALWSLGKNSWNEEVIKTCERILLTNGTYDSSAKTIALDILIESNPTDLGLAKVLSILQQKGKHLKELKEYLLQRLVQISEKNKSFEKQLKSIISSEGLNHYNNLAQGGLSTAFERRFMEKGFLSTTQEVMSGILKQGYVHVNLEENDAVHTVFTLGLFSNGLGSFISSDEGSGDSDVVNAGLELTVNGVEFRPFVFFEGNGELMGHVFSGAGSTLTPAYQAVLLLEDDLVEIPLAIGQVLDIRFSSVASVDLSGKIEISLWSRTADSLVQNRAGIITRVGASVASPFVQCEIEHDITAEPQLSLTSYTEFYDKMALCLQLQQPETVVEYTSNKHESILGTKQKVKKSKMTKIKFPGKSYALNSKNNEMCNVLHPSS